jgi:hypothetical protein
MYVEIWRATQSIRYMTFSVTDILWSSLESSQCPNRERPAAGVEEVHLSEHVTAQWSSTFRTECMYRLLHAILRIDEDYFPTHFGLCSADAVCFL